MKSLEHSLNCCVENAGSETDCPVCCGADQVSVDLPKWIDDLKYNRQERALEHSEYLQNRYLSTDNYCSFYMGSSNEPRLIDAIEKALYALQTIEILNKCGSQEPDWVIRNKMEDVAMKTLREIEEMGK